MQDLASFLKRSSMGNINGASMVRLPQTSIRSSTKLLSRHQMLITQFFPLLARFWPIQMLNASPPNSKLTPSKWIRLINSLFGSNKIYRLLVIHQKWLEISRKTKRLYITRCIARIKVILSSKMRHCQSKSLNSSNDSHRLMNGKILYIR